VDPEPEGAKTIHSTDCSNICLTMFRWSRQYQRRVRKYGPRFVAMKGVVAFN
jgi:hypothetical protein